MPDKLQEFKDFITPPVDKVIHTQIDLDITNLTISDVLRNINHMYPKNTIEREKIAHGSIALAVLCKSEYISPLKGVIIFITSEITEVDINSRKYAVIAVSEKDISSETRIMAINDKISVFLAKVYGEVMENFTMFYNRFLYNAYEAES